MAVACGWVATGAIADLRFGACGPGLEIRKHRIAQAVASVGLRRTKTLVVNTHAAHPKVRRQEVLPRLDPDL